MLWRCEWCGDFGGPKKHGNLDDAATLLSNGFWTVGPADSSKKPAEIKAKSCSMLLKHLAATRFVSPVAVLGRKGHAGNIFSHTPTSPPFFAFFVLLAFTSREHKHFSRPIRSKTKAFKKCPLRSMRKQGAPPRTAKGNKRGPSTALPCHGPVGCCAGGHHTQK